MRWVKRAGRGSAYEEQVYESPDDSEGPAEEDQWEGHD
jgi:hypothetical protein